MKRRIERNTEAEEAAIQRGIEADADNPALSDAQWAELRPAAAALPTSVYSGLAARRARGPQKEAVKEMISIRLDRDILERLREGGPGWQGRINDMLRKAVLG